MTITEETRIKALVALTPMIEKYLGCRFDDCFAVQYLPGLRLRGQSTADHRLPPIPHPGRGRGAPAASFLSCWHWSRPGCPARCVSFGGRPRPGQGGVCVAGRGVVAVLEGPAL
ncbi:MAG: hypothetical protein KJ650_06815 [Firmicutes bacterium]|nr:hypothetical protein [Bacillota bacterium]MBU4554272.1 hypothetical protein [Bacillota bacterium]MBV1726900.1 hypothetical protein [Desulforudis sp.]MBV1736326.1 hypothetical protein [Desulforudis sp.]MBV1770003.1 hypothetical protein [Desulforudis sp.]